MDYNKLKKAVESSNLSVSALFKKLNMDRGSFYYSIEKKSLKVETLEKICSVLELNVADFLQSPGNNYKSVAKLSPVAEEGEVYGAINYKEKYFETLEKLNTCNERLLAFTDLQKGLIKEKNKR